MKRSMMGVLVAVAVVAVACAGSSGGGAPHFCYRSTHVDAGPACQCFSTEQTLSAADWATTSSCAEASRTFCCSNADANGQATRCSCFKSHCFRDSTGYCACGNGWDSGYSLINITDPGVEEVDSCSGPGITCCEGSGTGCWCAPDLRTDTCTRTSARNASFSVVSACSAAQFAQSACTGESKTSSCDTIAYRPPSSGGGGGTKECTTDGQCSSKCGDCYSCRSGSCKCGYRGTASKACIF